MGCGFRYRVVHSKEFAEASAVRITKGISTLQQPARKTRRQRHQEANKAANARAAALHHAGRKRHADEWAAIHYGLRLRTREREKVHACRLGGQIGLDTLPRWTLAELLRRAKLAAPKRVQADPKAERSAVCCWPYATSHGHKAAMETCGRKVLTLAEISTLLAIGCVERNPGPGGGEQLANEPEYCLWYQELRALLQDVRAKSISATQRR